jgi:surfeit locus 1 family protein
VSEAAGETRVLSITRAGLIGTIVVLIVAGACVRLGFWQLDRLQQRRARNAVLIQRMQTPPLLLERAPTDTAGLIYRRARIEGRFDHDRTIVLAGRSLRGVPGAHVLTPILLGRTTAVLVNLGWLPAADGATVNLDSLEHPPKAVITGWVLPFPRAQRPVTLTTSTDSAFQHVWFTIDPEAIRRQVPYALGAIQVQAAPDTAAPPYPIRLAAPETDEGPHLGYAIQWFSFAAIALIGWTVLLLTKDELRLPRSPSRN